MFIWVEDFLFAKTSYICKKILLVNIEHNYE